MNVRAVSMLCVTLCGCGGLDVKRRAETYHAQKAQERIADYEQARVRGDLLGLCVKANLVSAAYLDAKDPGNARAWDARRAADCEAARAVLAPDVLPADR